MKTTNMLLIAALLAAAPTMALARQAPSPGQSGGQYDDDTVFDTPTSPGPGKTLSAEKREEIRKKIESVRIWKLTEALKLDANASAKLVAFLSSVDQKRRDIMMEQMKLMRELRLSLKTAKPDEAKIRSALDTLEKNHHAMQALRESEWKGLKDILTTEQQARFLVFQQKFQREMRRMIAGAQRTGPGRGGNGRGGGQEQ